MNRRDFLGTAGAGSLPLLGSVDPSNTASSCPPPAEAKLAGMTIPQLRDRYQEDLFSRLLPFWKQHGIDDVNGGFLCSLDYDGRRVSTEKQLWFQGRGIWVYSFLYNHFKKDPFYLAVARQTKDFVLRHAPQPDGWWAEVLSETGEVVRPFRGDVYGMYFVAEGLQEYAWASGDEEALQKALDLIWKLHAYISRPSFRMMGTGEPGVRAQGLWMVNLRIATQILNRWKNPKIEAIASECVDAIINKHYNPEIGLNNELLNFDFSRPKGQEHQCLLGHSVETLWMVMEEALRCGDDQLWTTCASRIHHHLDVGWDYVYGGLAHMVDVDNGCHEWPPEHPVGTNLEFRFVGEYNYMKTVWALNEVLVATLNIFERTGADWARRYFGMAQKVIDDKLSMRKYGQPGFMLFSDRKMKRVPHTARQDNYHPLRQLMLNLLVLNRMIKTETG